MIGCEYQTSKYDQEGNAKSDFSLLWFGRGWGRDGGLKICLLGSHLININQSYTIELNYQS